MVTSTQHSAAQHAVILHTTNCVQAVRCACRSVIKSFLDERTLAKIKVSASAQWHAHRQLHMHRLLQVHVGAMQHSTVQQLSVCHGYQALLKCTAVHGNAVASMQSNHPQQLHFLTHALLSWYCLCRCWARTTSLSCWQSSPLRTFRYSLAGIVNVMKIVM